MGTIYIAAFIVACASSFSATPFAIWLSKRWGFWTIRTPEKSTKLPSRAGGLGDLHRILMGLLGAIIGFPRFRQLLAYRYPLYHHGEMLSVISLDKQLAGSWSA